MFGEELIAKLGLNTGEFDERLNGAVGRAKGFGGAIQSAFSVVAGAAVVGYFDQIIDRGGQLVDTAAQLNMTTDSIQALEYAGKMAGVSGGQLDSVYQKLAISAAEATTKNSSASKALAKLGIDAQAFIQLPLDRQLEAVAKASASAADKNAALSAVADLLGSRNAPRLNGVLQQLAAEGLDGVTRAAKEAGQVMSSETVQKFDDFGDRLAVLKTSAQTFSAGLLDAVMTFGERIGQGAAILANRWDGIHTHVLETAEAEERIAVAIEQINVGLKGTAATASDLEKLETARAKLREREMSDAEKIDAYLGHYLRKMQEAGRYAQESKEYSEAMVEAIGFQLKMGEVRAAQEKKRADDARREWEDQIKTQELIAKYEEESAAKQRAKLPLEAQIYMLARQRAELEQMVATFYGDEEAKRGLIIKLHEVEAELSEKKLEVHKSLLDELEKLELKSGNLTEAEAERLAILQEQTGEVIKQRREIGAAESAMRDFGRATQQVVTTWEGMAKSTAMLLNSLKGSELASWSDEALKQLISNDRVKVVTAKNTRDQNYFGGIAYDLEIANLETEIGNAQRELTLRQNVRRDVNTLGIEGARRNYNPAIYDKLVAQFVTGQTETQKSNDLLADIAKRFKTIVKD